MSRHRLLTRRSYLQFRTMADTGCTIWVAIEAVSSTAIEHPEWDMDEERTWDDWEWRGGE